jgi:hypothetical protein
MVGAFLRANRLQGGMGWPILGGEYDSSEITSVTVSQLWQTTLGY